MKLGSSINKQDTTGKPPIVYLMERYNSFNDGCDFLKLFRYLYEREMDLHTMDSRGRNIVLCVLDCKLSDSMLPLLQFFHSVGLDLKLIDNYGRNALHHLFANVVYVDKVLDYDQGLSWSYQITEREFPEASGNIQKRIYNFLTDDVGVLPTIGDKNGINAVMLALENCAGFSWIKDLLKLDIPVQEDDKSKNYFHFLAKSRAPDDKFETLVSVLLEKGHTVDENVLKGRPKQRHDEVHTW